MHITGVKILYINIMIVSKTPLRVSIVGGGTDFPSFYKNEKGQVISFAINKYIYVIVKERFDDLIVLNYTQHEIVNQIDEIKHDLIRECCRIAGISKSVEISTLADIPSRGSGLGSSSSVTVGLLNALFNFKGIQVSQEVLARTACKIEIEVLGNPIGKQDQFIAAYGGFKRIIFYKNDEVELKEFDLNADQLRESGANLILHFTNKTRNASTILSQQNTNIPYRINELKEISCLVDELAEAIDDGRYYVIGELLRKNWELKKSLSIGITSEEIDRMVNLAMENGASGCKIAGAGGGGFLLSYVDMDQQKSYRLAMQEYRELPIAIDIFGSRIIFNIQ